MHYIVSPPPHSSTGKPVEFCPSGRLKSGLEHLRHEPIRQAGCRLVREKLGTRRYKEMPAEDFFKYCYTLRSRLVHGELPLPARNEVDTAGANLEVMLSYLLSTDLLDVGPQP